MKNSIIAILLCAGLLTGASAFAGQGRGCSMSGRFCSSGSECESAGGGCPVTGRFFKKAHFLLENKSAMGLSEEQVKSIKALKADMKKQAIRSGAEMQVFMIDMDAKLSEETVDVAGITAMMDQAMPAMAASGKASVEAYAKLKAIPTKDQWAKMKALKAQGEEKND